MASSQAASLALVIALCISALHSSGFRTISAPLAGIPICACDVWADPLRLRGGALRVRPSTSRKDDPIRMDLDDEGEEASVKRRSGQGRQGGIVLGEEQATVPDDLDEEENAGARMARLLEEGLPKLHTHAKKVVEGKPPRIKIKKERQEPLLATMSGISKHGGHPVVKRASINCTLASAHGLFNVSDLATYLKLRIKVNGKMGEKQNVVDVNVDGDNVVVTAVHSTQLKRKRVWSRKLTLSDAFSTRYLKYLTRRFICKIELRSYLRVVSTDHSLASRENARKGQTFEIKYTNVYRHKHMRLKFIKEHGTRLEAARRELLNRPFEEEDNKALQINRVEMMMERKIKATGERVGGYDWVVRTRKTVGEVKEEMKNVLKHWIELQHKSYRQPFGGAMRGVIDRSITRHDPDRVGKGVHSRSTAGYSAPRVVRSMQGTKSGLESMMYTGTAPNGFKSTRKQMKAQKCEACVARKLFCACLLAIAIVTFLIASFLAFWPFKCEVRIYPKLRVEFQGQVARYRARKGWSVAGDADRTVYDWKPKHLNSGKMNLHKRDWR